MSTVKTHGHAWVDGGKTSPTYKSWDSMLSRCRNPNAQGYENYGGRGIKVCDTWLDFRVFLSDMGVRPSGTSIDRIDCNKGYEPGNCRWATRIEQARNTRATKNYEMDGRSMCLAAWAEEFGVSQAVVRKRVSVMGWDLRRALTTPVDTHYSRRTPEGGTGHTRKINVEGAVLTIAEVCKATGLAYSTVWSRLNRSYKSGPITSPAREVRA